MNFNKLEFFKKSSEGPSEVLTETVENSNEVKDSNSVIDIINKTKDFLKSKSLDLRLGAMVLVTMGSMEVVNAQEGDMLKYSEAINEVQSGKNKIENVANSFYEAYKNENIDSSCFVYEGRNSVINGELIHHEDGVKFSGVDLNINSNNDTIYLGNIEVNNFTVSAKESLNSFENNQSNLNEEDHFRLITSIKEIKENNNDSFENTKTLTGHGESAKEAFSSAMFEIMFLKKSLVKGVTLSKSKSESNNENHSEEQRYIDLYTVESHGELKNVKIVINEMSDKEYRKHYKKNMISNKEVRKYNKGLPKEQHISNEAPEKGTSNYYSAEVIYSE